MVVGTKEGVEVMIKVLELGSGINYYKATAGEVVIHTDEVYLPHIEKIVDFNKKLPFKDNSFDKVVIHHALEHTINYRKTMKEMHRVLKNGGILDIQVPCWGNKAGHNEQHTRTWIFYSLVDYCVNEKSDERYFKVKFNILSRRYVYNKNRLIGRFLEWFANKYPQFENQYCGSFLIKPFYFEYILEVIK